MTAATAIRRPGHERPWTSNQLAAIGARGRTLVSAAAGSGKTSVLVERIVRSLLDDGGEHQPPTTDPRGILAVTFTRKAAAEMRERVARELFAAGELELLGQLELATIGTIHSLCGSILREHGAAIGIDPGYTLLEDSQDSWYAQLTLDELLAEPPTEDVQWLLQRIGSQRAATKLAELRNVAARTLDGTLEFVADSDVRGVPDRRVDERDAARSTRAISQLWNAFQTRFRARLERAGALTYDDLERCALQAVNIPDVATALRERWQFVAIDEFQDTNERQMRILDAIAGDRLFMVGDQWQSIYRFRGADVAIFQHELMNDATAKVHMLENFRSNASVLDVVNGVFSHDEIFGAGGYRAVRPGSSSQSQAQGPAVELLAVPHAPAGTSAATVEGDHRREREARRVAERVADVLDFGAAPSDVVIVFESGWEIERFEQALRALDVPTLRAAATGYYDHPDVRDVVNVLRCIRNPLDDLAATAVLAGPLARASYSDLASVLRRSGISRSEHRARQRNTERPTLLDVAAAGENHQLATAAKRVMRLRELERTSSVVELVERIIGFPEFELAAAQRHDGVQRLANLRHLVILAAEARRVGVAGTARFLDYIDAQRRFQKLGEASIADEASGAVRLMTIHGSKGLEFEHVFYVKADHVMGDGGPPGSIPAPIMDEDGFVHVSVPSADGPLRDTQRLAELRLLDAVHHHEERMRKAYVAMTRAKSRLYVSAPVDNDAGSTTTIESGSVPPDASPLTWIRATLDAWHHGTEGVHHTPLLSIDGRPAQGRDPIMTLTGNDTTRTIATPLCDLNALGIHVAADTPEGDVPQPHALQVALAASVVDARDREHRLADGTRLHDAMARLIHAAVDEDVPHERLLEVEREPWLTPRTVERLTPVVESAVFTRLVEVEARAEVPWVASFGGSIPSVASEGVRVVADARDVDAGRFDVHAVLPDGRWWIVDWKVTLDTNPETAWLAHGRQLTRYAVAARRGGAAGCLLTLASLSAEPLTHCWDGSSLDVADVGYRPPPPPPQVELP